jgi:hypothetical protein
MKDTVEFRLALAEQVYAIEEQRLKLVAEAKKRKNRAYIANVVSYIIPFVVALKTLPKIGGFWGFVSVYLFALFIVKFVKAGISFLYEEETLEYTQTAHSYIFEALCQTASEPIIHTRNCFRADDKLIDNLLKNYFEKIKEYPNSIFLYTSFKDVFMCQKADNITFFFGSLECRFEDYDSSYSRYYNFHFVKVPNAKQLNARKYKIFSNEKLNGAISAYEYTKDYCVLCVLRKYEEATDADFHLDIFESLRETKTLEKIQKSFYTNLHSFEDLIALFD